jgi:hypothetical protein
VDEMMTTRISTMARVLLPLFALPIAGCDCGEQLQVLAPKIEIGDPYDAAFSVCETDFISDCSYDFGQVGINRDKLFSFAIKNPTQVTLNIESITLEGAPSFTFEGELPAFVSDPAGEVVTVKYTPIVEAQETAKVIIKSDGKNLVDGQDVIIDLVATGKELGAPTIVVDPAQCDFGEVGVGATGTCSLSIRNDGNMELSVTAIDFSADTPSPAVFGAQGVFPVPTFIQPGTAQSVSFYGTPNAPSPITGTLIISSNDPARPTVDVPFLIQGAQAPTAVGRVKSINGVANSAAAPSIEPLDNVVISGDQSVDANGVAANIVSWQWELVSKPVESSVTLSSPNAVDTGFRFSSASGVVNGLDVAGTFEVSLTVTDVNGAQSTNNAVVVLNSVPTEGLHIQLTWSADVNDIDLHLGRGNTPDWCSTDDCYYANCTPGDSFNSPDWDGGGYGGEGDPTLDIDDLSGFGPENTNIGTAPNGSYVVGVHAFSLSAATDVTVKIFVGGALEAEFQGHLDDDDDFWEVARVDVNGATNVVGIDTYDNAWSCF